MKLTKENLDKFEVGSQIAVFNKTNLIETVTKAEHNGYSVLGLEENFTANQVIPMFSFEKECYMCLADHIQTPTNIIV